MAEIKEIKSDEEYQEFINNPDTLNICKISANWCSPCRVLGEIIKNLTLDEVSGVSIGEIDADDEWFEDLMTELKVRGIPVLIAYKNGEEVDRVAGMTTKDSLLGFFGRNK